MTYPLSIVNILTVIAATGLVGAVAGVIHGRSIGGQTDQMWGVARPQPALGGAVIAIGVVAAALVDAVPGFLPRGRCSGRRMSPLQVRCSRVILPDAPWSMGTRAARSPHVDLEHP